MTATSLSLRDARRIALAAQGFGAKANSGSNSWRRVRAAIERMRLLQIDSIPVIARSHYLPTFSRIGAYDVKAFDIKAFHPRRRELFEYWGHEASLLPFATQPLLRWRMARAERLQGIYKQIAEFVRQRRDYVDQVLAEIHERGPLSARELSNPGSGGGSWSWAAGKCALEYLFWSGQITTVTRRNFERVYDLTERVLPENILRLPTPSEPEAQRRLIGLAATALGVATEADLRDYFRLGAADSKRAVAELVESGHLLEATVEGWRQRAYLDPECKKPRPVPGAALLSPFDPLVWERNRTERLFDFHYRLEIYTPAAKRRYGYYVLPFLLDEKLRARVDLKADREGGSLQVLAAYGESGSDPGLIAEALTLQLASMADWLDLPRGVVIRGRRGDLMRPLRQSISVVS